MSYLVGSLLRRWRCVESRVEEEWIGISMAQSPVIAAFLDRCGQDDVADASATAPARPERRAQPTAPERKWEKSWLMNVEE